MINIKIEAANGADARQQMLDLLGITGTQFTALAEGELKKPNVDYNFAERVQQDFKKSIELDEKLNNAEEEVPKPEQTTRKRRSSATKAVEQAALEANTGNEEPPASEDNVDAATDAFVEAINPTKEESSDMAETLEQDNKEQNDDFKAWIKANPESAEKQAEIYYKNPVEFSSTVDRDFMRSAAIVLSRLNKREEVKTVMGKRSFSAQPGKEQVKDEELNHILNAFVAIYKTIK